MPRSLNLYRLTKRIRLLLFLVAFLLISGSQLRMTSPRQPPEEDDVGTTFMGATVGTTMEPSSGSGRVNNSFARIPLTRGAPTRAANVSQKLQTVFRISNQTDVNPRQHLSTAYIRSSSRLPRDHGANLLHRWNSRNTTTCLTQGESSLPKEDWVLRAPHFLVLGHHKCGTQAMTQYLWDHPMIVTTNHIESCFFENFGHEFTTSTGVSRKLGRETYLKQLLKFVPSNTKPPFESSASDMVTFETCPRYFLDSDRNPTMILCIAPWVKLIVLLRNPVERVESHYNYAYHSRSNRSRRPMVTWRQWIDDDLKSLRKAGVIANRTLQELEQFSGSREEAEAWQNYTRSRTSQFFLGRGLYAIQFRQWYAAMDRIKKSRSDLLPVRSEAVKNDTQGEYSKILSFLGLEDHILSYAGAHHVTSTKEEHVPMPKSIRRELEEFYAPYNKQLYELLGDEWSGVWDP